MVPTSGGSVTSNLRLFVEGLDMYPEIMVDMDLNINQNIEMFIIQDFHCN